LSCPLLQLIAGDLSQTGGAGNRAGTAVLEGIAPRLDSMDATWSDC
jgi:hypothetical protein